MCQILYLSRNLSSTTLQCDSLFLRILSNGEWYVKSPLIHSIPYELHMQRYARERERVRGLAWDNITYST